MSEMTQNIMKQRDHLKVLKTDDFFYLNWNKIDLNYMNYMTNF